MTLSVPLHKHDPSGAGARGLGSGARWPCGAGVRGSRGPEGRRPGGWAGRSLMLMSTLLRFMETLLRRRGSDGDAAAAGIPHGDCDARARTRTEPHAQPHARTYARAQTQTHTRRHWCLSLHPSVSSRLEINNAGWLVAQPFPKQTDCLETNVVVVRNG